MSPKKITDADKLEIINLYRQSGDTTASLANRYGVSNSTISRLLKTSIPEAEYDLLIQQKRGSKVVSEEEGLVTIAEPMRVATPIATTGSELDDRVAHLPQIEVQLPSIAVAGLPEPEVLAGVESDRSDLETVEGQIQAPTQVKFTFQEQESGGSVPRPVSTPTEDAISSKRLVRRRSSAPAKDLVQPTPVVDNNILTLATDVERSVITTPAWESNSEPTPITPTPTKTNVPPPVPRQLLLRDVPGTAEKNYLSELADPVSSAEIPTDDSEEDDNPEDVNALAAMFGEEISDGDDDDDDFTDDEDWEEESTTLDRDRLLTPDRLQLQVTPLSQAKLPRTCYIVIDKFAELIVRPLKDFAELGQIPGEEIQQRTLPIFDNHRVAKRFSNQRTQRVIKVPDSQVFYKTIQHLRSKGIARLLVDGNIYSLN
jgi:transposase-like protein